MAAPKYFSGCAHTTELSQVLLQRPVKLDPLSWQQTMCASAKFFCLVQPACSQPLHVACFLDNLHHCLRRKRKIKSPSASSAPWIQVTCYKQSLLTGHFHVSRTSRFFFFCGGDSILQVFFKALFLLPVSHTFSCVLEAPMSWLTFF